MQVNIADINNDALMEAPRIAIALKPFFFFNFELKAEPCIEERFKLKSIIIGDR